MVNISKRWGRINDCSSKVFLLGTFSVNMDETVLLSVCRACLTEEGEFQSIFTQDECTGLEIHLAEMIMAYASVQITVGDGLPESICLACAEKASKLYLFKKQCEESDAALRSRLGKSPYAINKEHYEVLETTTKEEYQILAGNQINKIDLDMSTEDIIIKPEINDEVCADIAAAESDEEITVAEQARQIVASWQEVEISPEHSDTEDTKPVVPKIYECDSCSKAFAREDLWIQHKKFHGTKQIFVENQMVNVMSEQIVEELEIKEIPSLEILRVEHIDGKNENIILQVQTDEPTGNSNSGGSGSHLECTECHKKFNKPSHLTRHMKIHAKIKPFACNLCDKRFVRPEQLTHHVNMHSGVKPHVCKICSKGFNQISNLKDHLRTHNGEKPFLCSTCGKGFNQLGNLRQHTIRHSGIKAHLCSICGNGFASKGELCAHLRKHTGARPFVCPICNHGFTTSSSLTKHKRIHSGEKPYECEVCKMRFSRSGILARHRRTHTGEKPYVCKYCSKAFSQSNDLSSHLRIHTGEKPFICDVCGQAFRQSSALKTHKKTHIDRSANVIESKRLDSKLVMVHSTFLNTINNAVLKPEYASPVCEDIKVNFM